MFGGANDMARKDKKPAPRLVIQHMCPNTKRQNSWRSLSSKRLTNTLMLGFISSDYEVKQAVMAFMQSIYTN